MQNDVVSSEINKIDSSKDLLLCVEKMESSGTKPTVYETAALQLSLHQINTDWKLMAREDYRNNDEILSYLATENPKDNIKGGWAKFIAAIKKVFCKGTRKTQDDSCKN